MPRFNWALGIPAGHAWRFGRLAEQGAHCCLCGKDSAKSGCAAGATSDCHDKFVGPAGCAA
jgi:hypothetical protein